MTGTPANAAATLPQLLLQRAAETPTAVCQRRKVRGIWKRYDWAAVLNEVRRITLGLCALGLQRGEVVVLIGENRPELFWAEIAVQAAGGVCVCLYPDATAEELRFILEDAEAVLVVAEDQEQVDKAIAIRPEAPRLRHVAYCDPRGLWSYREPWLLSLDDLRQQGEALDRDQRAAFDDLVGRGSADDVALLSYTSGTTGRPKGVVCTHGWLIGNARRLNQALGFPPGCQYLSYISPAWGPEQVVGVAAGLLVPLTVNFPEKPEEVLRNIRELAVEALAFSPRQWEGLAASVRARMLAAGRFRRALVDWGLAVGHAVNVNRLEGRPIPWHARALYPLAERLVLRPLRDKLGLTRARIALCGGSSMAPDLFRFFHAMGVQLRNIYGTSEFGLCSVHQGERYDLETVGNWLPDLPDRPRFEWRVDANGELLLKGGTGFAGYHKQPEKTRERWDGEWFRTGDAVTVTDAGEIVILDRIADLRQLAGGQTYPPQYLETRLRMSPFIRDVLIVGDRRRAFVSALIDISFEVVAQWAEERRVPFSTLADLSQSEPVIDLMRREIERVNRLLEPGSRITRFANFPKALDPDEGELTRTRKLRRDVIEKRYADLIDAIYRGDAAAQCRIQVTYSDGRQGLFTADVRIADTDPQASRRGQRRQVA